MNGRMAFHALNPHLFPKPRWAILCFEGARCQLNVCSVENNREKVGKDAGLKLSQWALSTGKIASLG
jgi:hypothetical protein